MIHAKLVIFRNIYNMKYLSNLIIILPIITQKHCQYWIPNRFCSIYTYYRIQL